jgi:hypothetical protein
MFCISKQMSATAWMIAYECLEAAAIAAIRSGDLAGIAITPGFPGARSRRTRQRTRGAGFIPRRFPFGFVLVFGFFLSMMGISGTGLLAS